MNEKKEIIVIPVTFQDEFLMVYNESLNDYEFPKFTLKEPNNLIQKFTFFYEVNVKEIQPINNILENKEEPEVYLAFHCEIKNLEKASFKRFPIKQVFEKFDTMNFEEMKKKLKDYYAYKTYLNYIKNNRKPRVQNQNLREVNNESIVLK